MDAAPLAAAPPPEEGGADGAPAPASRQAALAITVGVALVLALAAALPLAARARLGPLTATVMWGLVLIVSCAGWGRALGARLFPGADVDFGLAAAWGMCVTLLAGGLMCLVSAARTPVLVVWVLGGLALCVFDVARRGARLAGELRPSALWRRADGLTFAFAMLLALAFIQLVGGAGKTVPNPSDDLIAYSAYPRMMLQSGTFLDPFSLRRMGAYGGHSFGQALMLIVGEDLQIHFFDGGICMFMLVALVMGELRRHATTSRAVVMLTVLAVVTLPEVRINTASEFSGALLFLALFRTVDWLAARDGDGNEDRRGALLLAMVVAATCTLRQNYMAPCAVLVAAAAVLRGNGLRSAARHVGLVGALSAAWLLPWAALAFRSNHTFLFPVFAGNYSRSYGALTSASDWSGRLRFFLSNSLRSDPVRTMPLFVLLAPALSEAPRRRPLAAFWLAAAVGFAMLVYTLPLADEFTISRYNFACGLAFMLAACLTAGRALGRRALPATRDTFVALLLMGALLIHLNEVRGLVMGRFGRYFDDTGAAVAAPPPLETKSPAYAKMQAAVPAGETLLVMVERPYWLDFGRNRIFLIDLPGAVSPAPGIPLLEGPEAVAAYLQKQGIRYFAFADPDRAEADLYRRAHWEQTKRTGLPIWRLTAPYYLAAFDAATTLAKTRKRLFEDGHLILVDLSAKR